MERILSTVVSLNFLVPLNAFSGALEDFSEIYGNEQTVAIATGYSMLLAVHRQLLQSLPRMESNEK